MGKVVLVVSVHTGRILRAVVVVIVITLKVVMVMIEVVVVRVMGYTMVMATTVVLVMIGEAWDWEIMYFRGESTWVKRSDMSGIGKHLWGFSWHRSAW